jgi:hypothetical protein
MPEKSQSSIGIFPAASVRHRYSGIRVLSGTADHGLFRHCPAQIRDWAAVASSRATNLATYLYSLKEEDFRKSPVYEWKLLFKDIRNYGVLSWKYSRPAPKFKDPVFAKTRPKRSFSVNENARFGLVFAKTGSLNCAGREYFKSVPVTLWASLILIHYLYGSESLTVYFWRCWADIILELLLKNFILNFEADDSGIAKKLLFR